MLLIYGKSFSILENGPSWKSLSSRKWSNIFDGKSFSSSKNGPEWTVMVQKIVDVQ
jgi:hypothetical protein